MLTIENINKIVGRQIDSKWEIYAISNRENGTEYLFVLVNVGYYKHYQWAIALDRQMWGDGYRMYCIENAKEHDTYIKPNEIHSIDFVVSEMAELLKKTY